MNNTNTNTNNTYISNILKLYNNAKTNGSVKDKNKYYKILQKHKKQIK